MPDLIDLREEIGERMRAGASLDDVESGLIAAQDHLDADEKAALWLFAWSFVPPVRQRNEALRLSGAVLEGHRFDDGAPPADVFAGVRDAVREHQGATRNRIGGPRREDDALYRRVDEALDSVQ
jgi:hypothetical protein